MTDIHCHLLPGVDDGPEEMEQSLAMVAQAVNDGISAVVATPHVLECPNSDELPELCEQRFKELERKVAEQGSDIRLFRGSEIYFQFDLGSICCQRQGTLAGNGKYPLIEFPLAWLPRGFEEELFKLQLSGFVPIIAHPERNLIFARDVGKVLELARRGVLLQVNGGSITGANGRFIRKIVQRLIGEGAVQFVASDAHDLVSRPLVLSKARKAVEKWAGAEAAEKLFCLNPERAIKGENIAGAY